MPPGIVQSSLYLLIAVKFKYSTFRRRGRASGRSCPCGQPWVRRRARTHAPGRGSRGGRRRALPRLLLPSRTRRACDLDHVDACMQKAPQAGNLLDQMVRVSWPRVASGASGQRHGKRYGSGGVSSVPDRFRRPVFHFNLSYLHLIHTIAVILALAGPL